MKREEVQITDAMTTGASGYDEDWLVGRTILRVEPVRGSDRLEFCMLLDNGTTVIVSCDPVTHAEDHSRLPPEKWGETWEVVMYDATDVGAGAAMSAAGPDRP